MTVVMMWGMRLFFPHRRHTLLNLFLCCFLICFLAYVEIREWKKRMVKLPLGESRTWPTEPIILHTRPDYSVKREGPGEMGEAVVLNGKERESGHASMKTWLMNIIASDKISLDRSLRDYRLAECKDVVYMESDLPKASVVIIFNDEAWTPLLRTVHSVINRSPPNLLEEVLLVDDFSRRDELQLKLERYIAKFDGKVRLLRLRQREGLIRAKLQGAREAKGEVIVFLDSHCEANHGWLEPLLFRIAVKRTAVVCPVIDRISAQTLAYSGDEEVTVIGGFSWSLHFRWDPIPEQRLLNRTLKIDPISSPTMAGGLLAANRKYFLEIGGYDPGMDIGGSENLEISFRVWMCGGSIEIIPCSHVGHIFRDGHSYNMTGLNGNRDMHGTNSKRLAEVWMDGYKRFFYAHRHDLLVKDVGNLTERIALRKSLKCNNFKWYLDRVIPDKFVLDENVDGYGALKNPATNLCLDTMQKNEGAEIPLAAFACQSGTSTAQMFSLSKTGELRRELSCATVANYSDGYTLGLGENKVARLKPCSVVSKKNAVEFKWKLEKNGLLRHLHSNLCVDVSDAVDKKKKPTVIVENNGLPMRECSDNAKEVSAHQRWRFS